HLGDLCRGGRFAGNALRGGGSGEARDHVKEEPGKQGHDQHLDDGTSQPIEYAPSHRRVAPGSRASWSPSPRRLKESMVRTRARPGTSARDRSTWYMPEV